MIKTRMLTALTIAAILQVPSAQAADKVKVGFITNPEPKVF